MKKVLLSVLAVWLLASCVTVKLPAPSSSSELLDYSLLTNQGIYVTESNSVSFDYQAIGSISITERGGWVKKEKAKKAVNKPRKNNTDDFYINSEENQSSGKMTYVAPNIENAMEHMAAKLKEVRANGIINLNIHFSNVAEGFPEYIVISGMAIRK